MLLFAKENNIFNTSVGVFSIFSIFLFLSPCCCSLVLHKWNQIELKQMIYAPPNKWKIPGSVPGGDSNLLGVAWKGHLVEFFSSLNTIIVKPFFNFFSERI